jgi:hypothetical protein
MTSVSNQTSSTARREGTAMASQRSKKRLLAASIVVASLGGSVIAAHADTFAQRAASTASLTPPATWPSIPSTACAPADVAPACTIALNADPGTVTVKDTTATGGEQTVPFWGFGVNTHDVTLAGGVNLTGARSSTIKVPVGTVLTITLAQNAAIPNAIDLSFPSLPIGAVTHAGSVYTVHADKVGTSVFQPGSNANAPRQVAMGLVGTLIVTPKDGLGVDCPSCAYDPGTPFADEAIVATTDIDPEFAANPAAFEMSYFAQPRDPNDLPRRVYHLINGKSFPSTDVIDARIGDRVLLRYVNAGVTDKSMGLLGVRQSLLARNSSKFADAQTLIAPLVGPGETADVGVSIPATAATGQRYSLVDQGRQMNHGNASGFGGALTFLNVWSAPPTVDTLAFTSATGTLTATGHAAFAGLTVTGYQTAVTATATPPTTWLATVAVAIPAANVAISTAPITAAAGQFVWVRVQQSGGLFSAGASIQVPVPVPDTTVPVTTAAPTTAAPTTAAPTTAAPTTEPATTTTTTTSPPTTAATFVAPTVSVSVSGSVLTINGQSDPALTVAAAEYWINTADPGPGLGTQIVDPAASQAGNIVLTSGQFGLPAINATADFGFAPSPSDQVWVRIRDSNGTWSSAVQA